MRGTDLFAFYGSLRRGMGNYKFYESDLKYIETRRITGYKLYALKDYPYAVRSSVESDSLVIEIFQIEDSRVVQAIHQMELEAGYVLELIEVDGAWVGIYLFEQAGDDSSVESGDWVEFYGANGG